MKATLFVIPGSHPSMAARLMLEAKGLEYRRIDLIPVISKGVLKAAGFPGTTVPAMRLDGRRIQGTGAIARALDEAVPEPRLIPTDPERRARVEEAEEWADTDLQDVVRRIIWNVLDRDPRGRQSYLEGAKLGVPVSLAVRTAAPLVYLSKRFNEADDDAVRRDLAELPRIAEHVDELLAEGVIGTAETNVADYQIATGLRLALTLDDVRPALEGHDAEGFAMRLVPEFPGYAPAALPDEWKPWLERESAEI
jgi:glutathione S-transferase